MHKRVSSLCTLCRSRRLTKMFDLDFQPRSSISKLKFILIGFSVGTSSRDWDNAGCNFCRILCIMHTCYNIHVCMHMYVCICVYVLCIYTHLYTYTYTHIYIHIHTYTHISIYICHIQCRMFKAYSFGGWMQLVWFWLFEIGFGPMDRA